MTLVDQLANVSKTPQLSASAAQSTDPITIKFSERAIVPLAASSLASTIDVLFDLSLLNKHVSDLPHVVGVAVMGAQRHRRRFMVKI